MILQVDLASPTYRLSTKQTLPLRSSPLKILQFATLVTALLLAAVGAAACSSSSSAAAVPPITSVTYHQSKAVLNFDSSPHTETDPARTQALRLVLQKNGWLYTATTSDPEPRGCSGGTSTYLQIAFADGKTSTLTVHDCGRASHGLTSAITALVDSWHGP